MESGFRGGMVIVLVLVLSGAAVAGPPRIEEERGWWQSLSPTTWSMPQLSLPSWPLASSKKPAKKGGGTGIWDSVTRPARSAWTSTKRVFSSSGSGSRRAEASEGGFWSSLWAPAPPERSIETVTDFLAQPAPY